MRLLVYAFMRFSVYAFMRFCIHVIMLNNTLPLFLLNENRKFTNIKVSLEEKINKLLSDCATNKHFEVVIDNSNYAKAVPENFEEPY